MKMNLRLCGLFFSVNHKHTSLLISQSMKKKKKFFIIFLPETNALAYLGSHKVEMKLRLGGLIFSVADKHTSLLISQSMKKKKDLYFFLPNTKTPAYFIPHLVTNE
jgi:hypothetical protein